MVSSDPSSLRNLHLGEGKEEPIKSLFVTPKIFNADWSQARMIPSGVWKRIP
jgi:hypothetical protein